MPPADSGLNEKLELLTRIQGEHLVSCWLLPYCSVEKLQPSRGCWLVAVWVSSVSALSNSLRGTVSERAEKTVQ